MDEVIFTYQNRISFDNFPLIREEGIYQIALDVFNK